jgi:hypothetical protein
MCCKLIAKHALRDSVKSALELGSEVGKIEKIKYRA